MISRSTLVGALVVVELAIVGLAFSAFDGLRAPSVAIPVGGVRFNNAAMALPASLEKTFATGAAPHVVVDLHGVDVRIDTASALAVHASELTHVAGYVSGTIPQITAEPTADGVRIASGADTSHAIFVLGDVSRTLHLSVPANANVEILSAARIDATGLRAKLIAHSPSGGVRVHDHRADLDLSCSDGVIELTDVQGKDLALNTHAGRLYLTRVAADRIDAHSNYGRIYAVDVAARDGALSTHSGRISVSFSGASDAVVSAGTRSGHVSVSGLASTRIDKHNQTVQLGAGQGRFEVTTDDGDVNISQGANS